MAADDSPDSQRCKMLSQCAYAKYRGRLERRTHKRQMRLVDLEQRSAAQHWDMCSALGQGAIFTRTLLHHEDSLQLIVPKATDASDASSHWSRIVKAFCRPVP